MAQKDPAALFYIDNWLTSTAEMDADCRGWYLNLILHQYDKKDLPNDIEKLAVLAGVKFSEFERFKQVFKQVLEQKFTKKENNFAKNILSNREQFKEKRTRSGNIGVILKMALSMNYLDKKNSFILKSHLYTLTEQQIEDAKDKQVLKQMVDHLLKLYINGNGNNIIGIKEEEKKEKIQENEIGGERIKEIATKVWTDKIWAEQISIANHLKPTELRLWMGQFNASVMNDSISDFDEKKYKKMFGGWLKTQQSKGYQLPKQQFTQVDVLKKI
jgi:hypothetical protein